MLDDVMWVRGQLTTNCYDILTELDSNNIPYKFIRLGGDVRDMENHTEDMPTEISGMKPEIRLADPDNGSYELVYYLLDEL